MEANTIIKDVTKVVLNIRKQKEEVPENVYGYLETLIKESTEIFDLITEHQNAFLNGKEKHISFYYEALDKLTGCYMYLAPISFTLKALEKNRAVSFYHGEKIACEKAGNKFIQGATEKEAEFFVKEENYVANVFEGFVESCMQAIQTCRVRIREVEMEK